MDKSRQYIQMCKTSKEIQDHWQPKTGDFFANNENVVNCWLPSATNAFVMKKGFGIKTIGNLTQITRYIWLPRLDQLIEAAQLPHFAFRNISFMFYEWVKEPYSDDALPANTFFPSLEQMWIGFIMDKKFNKKWSNKTWV